jgi:hypothetical protein
MQEPVGWLVWPSFYKIMSFKINLSMDQLQYSRTTYDILKLLGDVGGLQGSIFSIVMFVYGWFATFNGKIFVLTNLFDQSNSKFKDSRNSIAPSLQNLLNPSMATTPFFKRCAQ